MKVLHVINCLSIGGAERLVSDILPLMKDSINVDLLVFRDEEENDFIRKVKDANINIRSLHAKKLYNPNIVLKIREVIKEYDIVHVHLFPASYWTSLASIGLHTKLVWTEHSTFNKRRGKWYFKLIECFIYSRYDRIISISEQTQQSLMSWLGRFEDSAFKVINNGVNLANYPFKKDRSIKDKSIVSLIMVSRFTAAKDQDTIIRAMPFLPERIRLVLVGDGDRLDACKSLVRQIGVEDRVQFAGRRTDIPSLLCKADIGIQSSHWEGFGLTVVEMMSTGLPVVVSDVDGVKQVAEGAGVVVKHADAQAFADAVKHIVEDDRYYDELSRKSYERSKEYDINRMVEEYINEYKKLIGNNEEE